MSTGTPLTMLPVSARLAWWGTAWLHGAIGPDDLLDHVLADDVTHVVLGGGGGIVDALAGLRRDGATAVGATFPAPGHPVGLGGPAPFNGAALDAGEAVVMVGAGVGWVPVAVGPTVEWHPYPAERRPLPDLAEADQSLRLQLLAAGDALATLDVARWQPEAADLLRSPERNHRPAAPPGTPPRCLDLATRALWAWEVAEVALADHGAAVSAGEIEQRRRALAPLQRAAQVALTVACSPESWPPAPDVGARR